MNFKCDDQLTQFVRKFSGLYLQVQYFKLNSLYLQSFDQRVLRTVPDGSAFSYIKFMFFQYLFLPYFALEAALAEQAQ